jgi:hypothetical protein
MSIPISAELEIPRPFRDSVFGGEANDGRMKLRLEGSYALRA